MVACCGWGPSRKLILYYYFAKLWLAICPTVYYTLNSKKNSMSCVQIKDSNQHTLYNSTRSSLLIEAFFDPRRQLIIHVKTPPIYSWVQEIIFQHMLDRLGQPNLLGAHFFLYFHDEIWTKPMSLGSKRHLGRA
jgi:hypothetical protein